MPIKYILAILRIFMGWIFLWTFLDKLFGFGFSTNHDKSWLNGSSPTLGFLNSAKGPFEELFNSIAGTAPVDWLFMMGMLLVGLALIFGIAMKIASWSGSLIMLLIFSSVLPPKNNPFIDQHIIYILVLTYLCLTKAGDNIGFGKKWSNITLIKKYNWLK
ncbi:DoxX family protein [Patescibacteria group bacterium]|nr:DoxX family protein [Patescibacteria group bacterium]